MIPEAKKTAVEHALRTAFGVSEFEGISQLTAGLSSALIFRILVLGKPYLLRVITSTEAVKDPAHWYASMTAAAAAGVAPRVLYTNIEDRVAITDFVGAKAFQRSEARTLLPGILKCLHSLPQFPRRLNYLDAMDGFVRKFQAAKILPESLMGELFRQYERVRLVYPRNEADLVSCHNDLKPENILFDGTRVWLVDWEAAFLNDRYVDLAVVSNFVITSDDEEKDFLERYFGAEVNEYHLARLFLMRQMLHMFYLAFMLLYAGPFAAIEPALVEPGFRDFHNQMWAGKIVLKSNEMKQQYALVHLEQFRQNCRLKRFDDSLQIVSDR